MFHLKTVNTDLGGRTFRAQVKSMCEAVMSPSLLPPHIISTGWIKSTHPYRQPRACWSPNSRFNLPSSFTFINRHRFSPVNPSQRQSLWFIASFFFFFFSENRCVGFLRRVLCCFASLLCFPVFRLFHHAHTACLQGALRISVRCSPASAASLLTASLHLICFSKVTRCRDTANPSPWFND